MISLRLKKLMMITSYESIKYVPQCHIRDDCIAGGGGVNVQFELPELYKGIRNGPQDYLYFK